MGGKSLTSLLGPNYKELKFEKLSNNTVRVIDPDGTRRIRLHHTDILTFRPDGTVIIKTGGWRTATTADRINIYGRPHDISVSFAKPAHYMIRGVRVPIADTFTVPPEDTDRPEQFNADSLEFLVNTTVDPDRAAWYASILRRKAYEDGTLTLERIAMIAAAEERSRRVA